MFANNTLNIDNKYDLFKQLWPIILSITTKSRKFMRGIMFVDFFGSIGPVFLISALLWGHKASKVAIFQANKYLIILSVILSFYRMLRKTLD